eukprot:4495732-Heterocapsa_arctica.AAC.1
MVDVLKLALEVLFGLVLRDMFFMSTYLSVFDNSLHVYPSSTLVLGSGWNVPRGVLVRQAFLVRGGLEGAPRAGVWVMSAISHGLGGGSRDV